jgi:hypothetical protein
MRERESYVMADNVIPFDKRYRTKREIPVFRVADSRKASEEALAFLVVCEANFLSCAELTYLASKLSPLALTILKWRLKVR